MSDTELLPCAHCGGEADFAETNKKHVVECQSCVLSTSVPTHSKETAALYWNKRAPITLDQAKQVLAEAGMAAVSIKDCIDAANTMECRDAEEDATHRRFMKIQDAAVIATQEKPDA
jgi:hypothetical protein